MNPIVIYLVTMCLSLMIAPAGRPAEFPTKPVRIVVPNPPGGTVDVVARAVGRVMTLTLGKNIVIDSRPGGNNIIGTEIVARAQADGYTLLMVGTHFAINPLLHKLPYDGLNAFSSIAGLASTPNVLAVHPSVPARSVHDLIMLARTSPGVLNCASANMGTAIHLAMVRFQSLAKINMNYIPYQGGIQAVLSVVGGHADVVVSPLSDAAPHVALARLRALAVTSSERFELIKDVPTLAESGFPRFQALQWLGAVAPAGTPKAIIQRLSADMLRAQENAQLRAGFAKLGILPMPMSAEHFDTFVRSEMHTFARIIRDANVRLE